MQDFRMETFLTVCRLMNFTNAAKELNITQPAVSQHIRFIEEHYHVKLFYYEGKKLHLTQAGALLQSASTTMRHDDIILMEQMKTDRGIKLSFGATLTIGDFVLPKKLAVFLEREPDAKIRMLVDNTEALLKKINAGELDFAVIEGYFRKSEYEYKVWSRQHYIAVCGGSYTMQNPVKSLNDLFGERIILREQGSGTREIFERYMAEQNYSVLDFKSRMEIGSISAIKSLVSAGCGITFLYEAAVKPELESGALRRIPLTNFEIYNDFTMVWRKDSIFNDRYLRLFDGLLSN
ncbi:MAG: LysR family transcriptional regulator [Lawsonibacter sp.]|nr:LysR family transcriptional regulator [Lawsonibacter sp.]